MIRQSTGGESRNEDGVTITIYGRMHFRFLQSQYQNDVLEGKSEI